MNRLVSGITQWAMINDRVRHDADGATAIDEALPFCPAVLGKARGVLGEQPPLGMSVAKLLAEVGSERRPPRVPDEGTRHEAEPEARVPQPPTEVHIISGGVELWVKATDCLKRRAGDGEIAAREMLGLLVV